MSHGGKIWWNELNTWDPDEAKNFYQRSLGWSFDEVPGKAGQVPYWLAKCDGEPVCGIFTLRSPDFDGIASHWFTYLAVDDIDAALAEAVATGGEVRREKLEIPGFGTMAVVIDNTGAGFGMIEPAPQ